MYPGSRRDADLGVESVNSWYLEMLFLGIR